MTEPLKESDEISWIEFLNSFDEHIWPIFKNREITKDAALIAWSMNKLTNVLDDLLTRMLANDGEEE